MPDIRLMGDKYKAESLYQWDLNQVLEIYGLSLSVVPEIHFTNSSMDKAIVRQASMDAVGVVRVDVPNSLLQKPYTIQVYICTYSGATFETQYKLEISVKARNKPADYTLENDSEVYSFKALENQVLNLLDEVASATNAASAAGKTASEAKNIAAGKMDSFNGRKGAVIPQSGDYTAEMVGAAPAGYGLGNTVLPTCTFDEIDNIKGNGLWWASGGSPLVISGYPIGNSLLKQTGYEGGLRTQTLHLFGATTSGAYNYQLMRSLKTAGWGEWEWVNPPMMADSTEYRTAERYNGKPVYVKTINCGTFPESGGTKIPANIDNLASYVRATGVMGGTRTLPWGENNNVQQFFRVSGANIWLYSNNPGYTALDVFITLYYTKTTD